jgi:hypothetical protein
MMRVRALNPLAHKPTAPLHHRPSSVPCPPNLGPRIATIYLSSPKQLIEVFLAALPISRHTVSLDPSPAALRHTPGFYAAQKWIYKMPFIVVSHHYLGSSISIKKNAHSSHFLSLPSL